MKSVESVDHHIRFKASWDGHDRLVFIPLGYVEADAGRELSRAEAVAFVVDHLERYRSEARSMETRNVIEITRLAPVERD